MVRGTLVRALTNYGIGILSVSILSSENIVNMLDGMVVGIVRVVMLGSMVRRSQAIAVMSLRMRFGSKNLNKSISKE